MPSSRSANPSCLRHLGLAFATILDPLIVLFLSQYPLSYIFSHCSHHPNDKHFQMRHAGSAPSRNSIPSTASDEAFVRSGAQLQSCPTFAQCSNTAAATRSTNQSLLHLSSTQRTFVHRFSVHTEALVTIRSFRRENRTTLFYNVAEDPLKPRLHISAYSYSDACAQSRS